MGLITVFWVNKCTYQVLREYRFGLYPLKMGLSVQSTNQVEYGTEQS